MNHQNEPRPQTEPHIHEEIAPLAHSYWEQEGHPEGKADEHWRRAEAHLLSNRAVQKGESQQ
jgi:hypothetical protein